MLYFYMIASFERFVNPVDENLTTSGKKYFVKQNTCQASSTGSTPLHQNCPRMDLGQNNYEK